MGRIHTAAALVWSSGLALALPSAVQAQSIIPNGDGTGTVVQQPTGNVYTITGGTASEDGQNLFHSFETFGLETGEIANFLIRDPAILNVLGRINGGDPSVIDGTLQLFNSTTEFPNTQVNLFLLNPVGILFGPNAILNLPGNFTVTTADGVTFNGITFDAVGSPDYTNLVGQPQALLFRVENPGAIFNTGSLNVGSDQTLLVVAGTVVSAESGQINGGNVAIAALPGNQLVRLTPTGTLLSYELTNTPANSTLTPLSLPELLTGAGIAPATALQPLDANTALLLTQDLEVGSIQLISDRDIEVESLRAFSGNIEVTTERFFRANGIAFDFFSENEVRIPLGSVVSDQGSVTIRHGGNGLMPFIVGDAGSNGTVAEIVASADEITPTQSYLTSYRQGEIAILTGTQPPEPQIEPQPEPQPESPVPNNPPATDCISDCDHQEPPSADDSEPVSDPDSQPLLNLDPNLRGDVFADLDLLETEYEQAFVNYLGLDGAAFPSPTLPKTQADLALVAEATGIRPAIIYVSFVPPTAESLTPPPQALNKSISPARLSANGPVARPSQPSDLLELIVVTPEGPPIRKTISVTQAEVQQVATQLRSEVTNRSRLRTTTYLAPAQQLYSWLVEPLAATLEAANIGNLAFLMAPGLRSLPVAALHDGEHFIIERYSVGLMPSVSLTDLRYVDVRNTEVLAMGASNFQDQPALPAVPLELSTIAERLWPGDFLINETFTPDLLVASRQQKPYGIVHLATHGEFKSGRVENSYIQFWDQRLGIDQVRNLHLNNPPVELMVLSACRTALGNEDAELGFAGLAVQAGVKTALASLWKVDDVGTAGLMTQFYTGLRAEPIKAEALRQAQLAMLKGEIRVLNGKLIWSDGEIVLPPELISSSSDLFSHPYFWASFTVIGSPW